MNAKRFRVLFVAAVSGLTLLAALSILWGLPASRTRAEASTPRKQISESISTNVITIGFGGPLSPGSLGWPQANSVQLAISQTNAAGGLNVGGITYTLVLVTADDLCNVGGAINAANTLVNAHAAVVIGHTCSGASLVAQSIYNAAGIPMISAATTDVALTQHGYTTTFRTISHEGAGATLLANYLHERKNLSTSSLVESPNSTIAVGDIYSNVFTSLGGSITSRRFVTDTSFYTAVLQAIQAEHPAAIFFTDANPTNGGQFSKIAASLGMTEVIGWNAPDGNAPTLANYVTAAGAAADSDYAAVSGRRIEDMPGWPAFQAAYQAAHFTNSPNDPTAYGAFAYDAVNIGMGAIRRANSLNTTAIRNEIAATSDYEGVVGEYQGFDTQGDVIPQWAWLTQYQNGQWIIVRPFNVFLPIALR